MITFSVLVSLVSVALAIGMGLVLAHVVREDRRRSDARVAALSQMAVDDFLPEPEPASDAHAIADDLSDGLFKEPAADSPWRARIAIAGALALVAIVVLGIASLRSTTSTATGHQAETVATSLQLLELGHTQSGAGLTVAGRVQNPRGGLPVSEPHRHGVPVRPERIVHDERALFTGSADARPGCRLRVFRHHSGKRSRRALSRQLPRQQRSPGGARRPAQPGLARAECAECAE